MSAAASALIDLSPLAAADAGGAPQGWYLYGITRRGTPPEVLAAANDVQAVDTAAAVSRGDAAPLQLLECGGLAAVVRPVTLAEFNIDVLKERLRNASTLEAMVRSHDCVIDAIHARRAILPAKFGVVYSNAQDIVSALRSGCDTLLPQLHSMEGRDEWAVHVYAARAVVRERISARIPAIGRLRDEFAAARPGRAYFLERQLRDEMESATRQALASLAQGVFDRIAGAAVAGQVNRVARAADSADEVEILRGAFLVARDRIEHFADEVRAAADEGEGLRCECSGPWAPYSFASCNIEGAQ